MPGSSVNVWRLSSGAWVRLLSGTMSQQKAGTWTGCKRLWRQASGAWALVVDMTQPSAAVPGTAIVLVASGPQTGLARASWTTEAAPDDRHYYTVRAEWYRNGTLGQTNTVDQSVGSNTCPATWDPGDVVHVVLRYQTVSGPTGTTWTSGNITITAGDGTT